MLKRREGKREIEIVSKCETNISKEGERERGNEKDVMKEKNV